MNRIANAWPACIGPHLLGTAPEPPAPAYRNLSPDEAALDSLWHGTLVTGRLVRPDGSAAPNRPLQAGVYINKQIWKKRLGMEPAFYKRGHPLAGVEVAAHTGMGIQIDGGPSPSVAAP